MIKAAKFEFIIPLMGMPEHNSKVKIMKNGMKIGRTRSILPNLQEKVKEIIKQTLGITFPLYHKYLMPESRHDSAFCFIVKRYFIEI